MTVMVGVLLVIIIVLLMAGCVMIDSINYERHQNDEYFKKLRAEYDIQIQKYKNDIADRDKMIRNYNNIILKEKIK